VLVPHAAGVLSALGLAVSDLRRDYAASFRRPAGAALDAAFAPLEERARAEIAAPSLERLADARYAGQSFELTVPAARADGVEPAFHEAHERRYGYRLADPVEIVALRLVARTEAPEPRLAPPAASTSETQRSRRAFFDGGWHETRIAALASLGLGDALAGPAVVELPGATCVVRPGWTATVDGAGALVLERP
jgi:N-methylhydantoinase A